MSDFASKSYWLGADPYQPNPPLREPIRADMAIVGAGFAGLSTAFSLRQADPGLRVVVLESDVVGYGASGRNGGFAMTLFGLQMGITALRFGKRAAAEAQRFMDRAVDYVGELVREHHIDCDYEKTGLMTVALNPAGARRLQEETKLANELGFPQIRYIGAEETRREVNSPTYLGARVEDNCALLNPAKLVRGLKRIAEAAGAEIYEGTPVTAFHPGKRLLLETAHSVVDAERVVFATNAFSAYFPQLAKMQYPVYTYIVLTEPLTPAQLEPIGWQRRQGIEDSPNLVHYYRLTADNRLLMGGGDVRLAYDARFTLDSNPAIWRDLENHVRRTFPSLRDVRFTHRWGGPVSVPLDMAPAFGYLGKDRRVVYSLGCVGHGVSLMVMAGQLLRDLALGWKTELTDLFFVNRWTIPLPPEPIKFVLGQIIRAGLRAQDRWQARDR